MRKSRWCQGYKVEVPNVPTQFDTLAANLGAVTLDQQIDSGKLRVWVLGHYRSHYVPENLLKAMKLDPGTEFEMGAGTLGAGRR